MKKAIKLKKEKKEDVSDSERLTPKRALHIIINTLEMRKNFVFKNYLYLYN